MASAAEQFAKLAENGDVLNEAALAAYPAPVRNLAKQLQSYTLPLPGGVSMSKEPWISAIEAAKAYDKNFDFTKYPSRLEYRKKFESSNQGTPGGTIDSANRVIGHIGTLAEIGDQLHNGFLQPWNALMNKTEAATGMDNGVLNRYTATQKAIADEGTRFFRGTAGTEEDIQSKLSNLSPSLPPVGLKSGREALLELMKTNIRVAREKYKETMGRYPPGNLIKTEAQESLKKMGYDPADFESGSSKTSPVAQIVIAAPDGSKHPFATQAEAEAFKKLAGIK